MSRLLRMFVVFAVAGATVPALAQTADVHGTWTVEFHDGKAFLQVRSSTPRDGNGDRPWNGGDWSMGQSFPVEELSGLPANDQNLTAANVKFEMRREAGTLGFEGSFRDGRGAGLFSFTPRDAYTNEMRRLGYNDDLPLWRRFQLAVHDVGPRYINALKAEGFGTSCKLARRSAAREEPRRQHRLHQRDQGQGFRAAALENLVRTRDHGVTAEYIKAMKAEGFTGATLEEFVRTARPRRDADVRAGHEAARSATAPRSRNWCARATTASRRNTSRKSKGLGFSAQTLEQFVRLRDHGVKSEYVKELRAAGYDKLAPEGHGARPRSRRHRAHTSAIWRRRATRAADRRCRPHQGSRRSADYIADMKEMGLKDLTLAQIVRLRDHGITPGFINHARARGLQDDRSGRNHPPQERRPLEIATRSHYPPRPSARLTVQ